VLLLAGLAIAFAGLLRHLLPLGWGGSAAPADPSPKPKALEWAIVAVPVVAILGFGLWMPAPLRLALDAAARITAGGI